MIDEIILICLFVLITGACIGSFLNVVALRAISGESIVFPSSKCPLCGEPIKWYDNIPVISYFLTFKGKCRNCAGKVSIQYPLIEALTAVLFLVIFLAFGFTVKTLLLLILLSISIVIIITDFRKNEIYDVHSWLLIIAAIGYSLYTKGINNYADAAIGLIAGVFVMEAVARLSYYLVKKEGNNDEIPVSDEIRQEEENREASEKTEVQEAPETQEKAEAQSNEETTENEEEIDINKYVEENKRAFGEGDTYLAAAAGALLGWKYLLAAVAFAIILQAVCILPQFLMGLYKQKEYRLLVSLSSFTVIAVLYWILSNIFTLHLFVIFAFVIALIFFAIDSITRLKKTVNNQGFIAIPFGPALLCSMFLILFYGCYIISFLKKHIFMILG